MTHRVIVVALPHADENNSPERQACSDNGCDQLATINWRFEHNNGTAGDNPLCPTHAGEWAEAYATPGTDEWLGR